MSIASSGNSKAHEQRRLADTLQQALSAHQRGDLIDARRLYRVVLRKQPRHFDALHLLGLVEAQRGRPDRAKELIDQAIKINGTSAEVFSNLGNVHRQLGRMEDALASYDRALWLQPGHINALNNRGTVQLDLGRADEALASFDAALAVMPAFAGAMRNRGIALRALKRPEDALASFEAAIRIEPTAPALHADRGSVLVELGRAGQALAAFERAVALDPRFAEAHYDRGLTLVQLGRLEDALASFDEALRIDPRFVPALTNRGTVLAQLGRPEDALASFDQALAIDPGFLTALSEKGHAALAGARYELAAESFERLVARAPEYPYGIGNLLYVRAYCCDWQNFETMRSLVSDGIAFGQQAIAPGHLLALTDSPAQQLKSTRIWNADVHGSAATRTLTRYRHDRIRLAYLSANFHEHAVGMLIAGLIERHDRARFEVTAVSYGPDDGSALRARLVAAFDRVEDVRLRSDRETAELMEKLEIDIAVDLMGHTQGYRPGIMLQRAAPIQVGWLGYPGTTGFDCVDYILADARVVPEDEKDFCSEKVVYLPDTYFHYDDRRPIAERTPTRTEAGLPKNGFVFCCFNNNYKILPDVFAIWMRLLGAVDGAVLWLLKSNASAERNLRQAAAGHGIAPERLVFAERADPADHLARHRLADLFLDTLPYNAHTTACDALWTGLPVLTRTGSTFPARVAASQLSALGLPELITDSAEAYEALALKLAREPQTLAAIKDKLARHRATCPLFNTDRSRRHIEAAYLTMWERHQRDEPPESFAVPALSA